MKYSILTSTFLRKIAIIALIIFSINIELLAQDNKTVSLTVTGQGKTIDEAKTNGLRSAIEQAFGSFISSNTNILNDNLVKDEIVSITNGNIQKYDIVSETKLPGGFYATTLKAIVSISKLTSFCESKGIKVDFKGSLFAMNIAIQELNDKNELIAWQNTKQIVDKLIYNSFDYKIEVQDPKLVEVEDSKIISNKAIYEIPVKININMNQNYNEVIDLITKFCGASSLSEDEKNNYLTHGKNICTLLINDKYFYFRNEKVKNGILLIPWFMSKIAVSNFEINNGIDSFTLRKFLKQNPSTDKKWISVSIKNKFAKPFVLGKFAYQKDFFNEYRLNSQDGDYEEDESFIYFKDNEYKSRSNQQDHCGGINIEDCLCGGNEFFNNKVYDVSHPEEYDKIFNFLGVSNFLEISYNEIRTIDEIKKISEYTISPKCYLINPVDPYKKDNNILLPPKK